MKAEYTPYTLNFRFKAITSRAIMATKRSWFIRLTEGDKSGIGECALFEGLSSDDRPDYEAKLASVCSDLEHGVIPDLTHWPSLRFGLETALQALNGQSPFSVFPTPWSRGESRITINGLVWMGSAQEMKHRVREKLNQGFRCIKLKIGGVDFNDELSIISTLRKEFSPSDLELRLDANGAFTPQNALSRLEALAPFAIHSIEQPIKQGQPEQMARICEQSPIAIALDEELIGVNNPVEKQQLLSTIRPHYIILKPALVGGFTGADEWIDAATKNNIKWWATSALESNIGLNAIAQWISTKPIDMPQGLGTGALYTNNIPSPLIQVNDYLTVNPAIEWHMPQLEWR